MNYMLDLLTSALIVSILALFAKFPFVFMAILMSIVILIVISFSLYAIFTEDKKDDSNVYKIEVVSDNFETHFELQKEAKIPSEYYKK